MTNIEKLILDKGYCIIKKAFPDQLISLSNELIISVLQSITNKKENNFENLFKLARTKLNQHEIQVILAKKLVDNNIIRKILLSNKLNKNLSSLIGSDLEFSSEFELAINVKNESDPYLVKKYHQEFWSGVGLNSLLLWIPLNLKKGMGTMEVVKQSHKWGHIPHQNREPLNLPEHSSEIIKCQNTDVVIMTSLTLHRTEPNLFHEPRIAIPLVVRNFYFPTTGNEDLWSFTKYNFSFYSKFRKILGNPHFSPYRTLNSNRNNSFTKEKILSK